MSRTFEFEDYKVLWGTIVKEKNIKINNFPDIPSGQLEPMSQIDGLKDIKQSVIDWAKDFTPKHHITPVVASSWLSTFSPNSTGMDIHTDEDHGGTISAVCWFEGQEGQGGDLVLWDPRWENPKLWGGVKGDGKYVIPFKPGKIVMFPSSVWHGVTAYTGTEERRAINMVLTFKNVDQVVSNDLLDDELNAVADKLGMQFDGSNESALAILKAIKDKI
jgi:hypothetical protein